MCFIKMTVVLLLYKFRLETAVFPGFSHELYAWELYPFLGWRN